jgi:hypothetical protein
VVSRNASIYGRRKEIRHMAPVFGAIKVWLRAANPEFFAAVRLGKQIADDRAEQALYERAVGYDYDDGITSKGKPIIRHMPPDVGALRTWLYNRRPDRWRDKIEVTQTGTLSDLPSIEIKKRLVAKMIEWGLFSATSAARRRRGVFH